MLDGRGDEVDQWLAAKVMHVPGCDESMLLVGHRPATLVVATSSYDPQSSSSNAARTSSEAEKLA